MAEEQAKFDLDTWKNQGQERIKTIEGEIRILDGQRAEIDGQIDMLVNERVEIEKALGIYKEPEKGNGHHGKVMIRPLLLAALVEHEGEWMDKDDLVDVVQEEKEGATTSSIVTSLKRLARAHEHVDADEAGEKFRYSKETEATA